MKPARSLSNCPNSTPRVSEMYKNLAGQKLVVVAIDALTGLRKSGDAANITATLSKDGASEAATDDTNPTEVDMSGRYFFNLLQAETNGNVLDFEVVSSTPYVVFGVYTFHTIPGILKLMDDSAARGAIVDHISNDASTFQTDLSEDTNDHYAGNVLAFVDGNNVTQTRRISAYNGTSKFVTVEPAFDAEPSAGDAFFILGRIN